MNNFTNNNHTSLSMWFCIVLLQGSALFKFYWGELTTFSDIKYSLLKWKAVLGLDFQILNFINLYSSFKLSFFLTKPHSSWQHEQVRMKFTVAQKSTVEWKLRVNFGLVHIKNPASYKRNSYLGLHVNNVNLPVLKPSGVDPDILEVTNEPLCTRGFGSHQQHSICVNQGLWSNKPLKMKKYWVLFLNHL